MLRRVVITGLGFVCSIGNSAQAVRDSLIHLRHGLGPAPFLQESNPSVSLAGLIRDFTVNSPNPLLWEFPAEYALPARKLRGFAPHGLYALCAAEQAIGDAGLTPEEIASPETGLCAASAGSPSQLLHHHGEMKRSGRGLWNPLAVVSSTAGTLNFTLGAWYGIQGVNCGFVSACASSSHALGYACDEISLGRQERILVVGAEDCNAESLLAFTGMRALSRESDPAKASRPFDSHRDGFVGSGGGVCLVLEEFEAACRRGKSPYAEVLGWGHASDGFKPMAPHPEGVGLVESMHRAMKQARVTPGEIGYVNAHATSTPMGDLSEGRALEKVFSRDGHHPWVSSTKALTGHPLSMAGAMEAGFCALAQKEKFIPGAAHLVDRDPAFSSLNFPSKTLPLQPGIILSNSSGFGGSNVSVIFGPAPE